MKERIKKWSGRLGTADLYEIEHPTALVTWFMHIPGAHIWWQHYQLSVVHLRDIPGEQTAKKQYPEAQYELLIIALDPHKNPVPDDPKTWHHLLPANVSVQFHGVTDAQAIDIGDKAVVCCIDGQLFVEPSGINGAREQWVTAVRNSARELAAGLWQEE